MDAIKEMREGFYRAIYGKLKVSGTNIPLFHYQVLADQQPDVYGVISVSSNIGRDTLNSLNSDVVIQLTLVSRSAPNPNMIIDSLAGDLWNALMPTKDKINLQVNGFDVIYAYKVLDITRPAYQSSGITTLERIIQIGFRINHK